MAIDKKSPYLNKIFSKYQNSFKELVFYSKIIHTFATHFVHFLEKMVKKT
jgi:hypothetical protein